MGLEADDGLVVLHAEVSHDQTIDVATFSLNVQKGLVPIRVERRTPCHNEGRRSSQLQGIQTDLAFQRQPPCLPDMLTVALQDPFDVFDDVGHRG